jgi:lipoprotein NlpI
VLRLPHHTAATHSGRARIASDVGHLYDLIGLDATRRFDLDRVAF